MLKYIIFFDKIGKKPEVFTEPHRLKRNSAGCDKRSLEISEKLGWLEGMATGYGNLGVIYKDRGFLGALVDSFDDGVVTSGHSGSYGDGHFAVQWENFS
jgi:hypothetical protein